VAYVALKDGASVTPASLRAQLAVGLAEHMMPSAFVFVDAFPLTPNGKIDRKALPPPTANLVALDYVAPRGATEDMLCQVWARVLQRERVGINDNFFEVGGHSLLLVKLHSELSAAFPGRLAIADYFNHTTVAKLAVLIDAGQAAPQRMPEAIARAETRKQRMNARLNRSH
jgi:hypothetical protein